MSSSGTVIIFAISRTAPSASYDACVSIMQASFQYIENICDAGSR